jgi:hypothetical protein
MNVFAEMLSDLESNRLEVVLTPARDARHIGHCVRVAASVNPLWYRNHCARYASQRTRYKGGKFKTKVKRRDTLKTLKRLAERVPTNSRYADDFRKIAESWQESQNFGISARKMTLKIFGNKS